MQKTDTPSTFIVILQLKDYPNIQIKSKLLAWWVFSTSFFENNRAR